jgi:hypothetical protein
VPFKRGFAPVAFDELAWHEDVRRATGSAKRIGEETARAWNARGKPSTLSSPATRKHGMEPVSPAASRFTFLLPVDLSASSSDLPKGRTGGSISTIWHSACGTCPRAHVGKPSISAHIDGCVARAASASTAAA